MIITSNTSTFDFSGPERDDLIDFEEGLKHTILYDIETHSGEHYTYNY